METPVLDINSFATWDDAFKALIPAVKQQSVRVAFYTQVLYRQACASSFCKNVPGGASQMNEKYYELAYKCGLYHQIGKALVKPEYQLLRKDFTDEEIALYRSYTSNGRLLVASLQKGGLHQRKEKAGVAESPTTNISWLMVRDATEQHMERYDGFGYPNGRIGDDISPIAQLVGFAKELDRLSAETRSEDPFGEACDILIAGAGNAFSPELVEIFRECRAKCRSVYQKFIKYTRTVPKTIPLVVKKKNRPMGLMYRQIISGNNGRTVACEAFPFFNISGEETGGAKTFAEISDMLERTGMTPDVATYFLYEAADTLLRITNCSLRMDAVILQMFPAFFSSHSYLQTFIKLFEDQPVDKNSLLLTISAEMVAKANKGLQKVIAVYLKNGIGLLLDNWDPLVMPIDTVSEYGFKNVRPISQMYGNPEYVKLLSSLKPIGITVYANAAENEEKMSWLESCGVEHISAPLSDKLVTEDELISAALSKEDNEG